MTHDIRHDILHDMSKKLPKTASERGQLYLYANTQERKDLLEKTQHRFPDARSLSDAVFMALRQWESAAEIGEAVRPLVHMCAQLILMSRSFLRHVDDEALRSAFYDRIFEQVAMSSLRPLTEQAQEIQGFHLTDEETTLLRSLVERYGRDDVSLWSRLTDASPDDTISPETEAALERLGLRYSDSLRKQSSDGSRESEKDKGGGDR